MFLSMLSIDKKHIFLNLEIYMSKIDGDFSDKEKSIISTHCIEMHIDNNNFEPDMPRDEVLRALQDGFSKQEKKIVFLELVATILADDVYHESEKELVDGLANLMDICKDDMDEAFSIISDMKSVYERCAAYIM